MNKINRKGFTLVELLATIAILGLVVGFSTYGIIKLVNNSKEEAYNVSATSIKEAARLYSSEVSPNEWKDVSDYDYKYFCVTINELVNKGFLNKKDINSSFDKDTYVAVAKNKLTETIDKEEFVDGSDSVIEGICTGTIRNEIITSKPILNTPNAYTDQINITFIDAVVESTIKEKNCYYGKSTNNINELGKVVDSNKCVFENLEDNTHYYTKVCMITERNSTICSNPKDISTYEVKKPSIIQTESPNIIKIKYDDANIREGTAEHYFYSSIYGNVNDDVLACQILEDNSFDCDVSPTRSIISGAWYRTEKSKINIEYQGANETAIVIAQTHDGSNNISEFSGTFNVKLAHKVKIKFKIDKDEETLLGRTDNKYDWTTDDNGIIFRTLDGKTTDSFFTIDYGDTIINNGLPDYNNPKYINITKEGHTAVSEAEWKCLEGCTEQNKTFAHNISTYTSDDFCDASAGDCEVTLGVNWRKNKVNIKFKIDKSNEELMSYTYDSNNTYDWSTTNDGIIERILNENESSKTSTFFTIDYGDSIVSNGLPNYNNSKFIKITKEGHTAVQGAEWKCLEGCTSQDKTFSQDSNSYTSEDFCDTSGGDCEVTLGVNWRKNNITIKYRANGGSISNSNSKFKIENDYVFYNSNSSPLQQVVSFGSKLVYNESLNKYGLYNYNNSSSLDLTVEGNSAKSGAEWKCLEGCTGNFNVFNQNQEYAAGDFCDASNGDCTVVLGVNWNANKATIRYKANGGVLGESTNNNYGINENDYITYNGNELENTIFSGNQIGGSGLPNYNNSSYLNLNNSGSNVPSGEEWKCLEGCTGKLNIFNQAKTDYSSADFCDVSKGDCTVVLGVNWNVNKVTIRYKANDGTLGTSTNIGNYNINDEGYIMYKNNYLEHNISSGGTMGKNGLSNYNSSQELNMVRNGFGVPSGKEWKCLEGCTGNLNVFNQNQEYAAGNFCDASKGDCTVVLGVNWINNKVTIRYNANGGQLGTSTNIGNYAVDSSGDIKYKGSLLKHQISYGSPLNSNGLSNYNSSQELNLIKQGYKAEQGKEWKCLAGCTVQNETFNQAYPYNASTFCDSSNGDCEVTLGVNWQPKDITYNIVYKSESGLQLGSSTVTKKFGTTNTIAPKNFSGYTPPSSKEVTWDLESKEIVFTYTPIEYAITYNLSDGIVSGNPTSYTIETETFTLENPTRTGYTFTGWTGSNGTTPSQTVKIVKGSTGNKSYKANWTAEVSGTRYYMESKSPFFCDKFYITSCSIVDDKEQCQYSNKNNITSSGTVMRNVLALDISVSKCGKTYYVNSNGINCYKTPSYIANVIQTFGKCFAVSGGEISLTNNNSQGSEWYYSIGYDCYFPGGTNISDTLPSSCTSTQSGPCGKCVSNKDCESNWCVTNGCSNSDGAYNCCSYSSNSSDIPALCK